LRGAGGAEDLRVWGDPAELERILVNLVGNAVKYTRAGHVEVRLEREGESARLTVSDSGIGIPDSAKGHLFEEFYRAPNARECEERGTGLGLAIVWDLVQRLGGTISVQSEEGRGTVFTVLLPLLQEKP
jgi:signal transduction histidine kinase